MNAERKNNTALRTNYVYEKACVSNFRKRKGNTEPLNVPLRSLQHSIVIDPTYEWCRNLFKVVFVCRKSLGLGLRPYIQQVAHKTQLVTNFSSLAKYERLEYVEVSFTNAFKHYVTINWLAKKNGVVLFDKEYAFEDWYLGRCRNADGVLYTDLYNQLRGIEAENNESDSDKKP